MNKEVLIENNIKLQQKLSENLLEHHELGSLIVLLDSGREVELKYGEYIFSIFQRENELVCSVENQVFFDAYTLIANLKIYDEFFLDIWDKIEIIVLF